MQNPQAFTYHKGQLHWRGINLLAYVEEQGQDQAFYLSDLQFTRAQIAHLKQSLKDLKNLSIYFALKANHNPGILKTVHQAGLGVDIVSGGELALALKAGFAPENIVFSGVGKTKAELAQACAANIGYINVEVLSELDDLSKLGCSSSICLRYNPDVDAQTLAQISTGKKTNKFGLEDEAILQAFSAYPHLKIRGLSMHIGSQITDLKPYDQAFAKIKAFCEKIQNQGHKIDYLDLGGGFGVNEDGYTALDLSSYAALVQQHFQDFEGKIFIEPGRLLVAGSAIILSQVIRKKQNTDQCFYILSAAMNDFMRPALYGIQPRIIPLKEYKDHHPATIAGPVCESTDVFRSQINFPVLEEGDWVAIALTGAYGHVMANTYNQRPILEDKILNSL